MDYGRARLHAFVALALLGSLSGPATEGKESEVVLAGKRVPLEGPWPATARGLTPWREVQGSVRAGDEEIPTQLAQGRLRVAPAAGAEPSLAVEPGKVVTLLAQARRIRLLFDRSEGERWRYRAAEGWRYNVEGEELLALDLDCDGLYFETGVDGIALSGGRLALPFSSDLPVGERLLHLPQGTSDGARIRCRIEPLADAGRSPVLALLNRHRAWNGLPPVTLDPALSRGCQAHAAYLRLHRWSGLTNPHEQTLGPEGASAEGAKAAADSCIQRAPGLEAIDSFWRSYFHRVPLMDPRLRAVGLNEDPRDLTVMDFLFEESEEELPQPTFVPANGAVGFPVRACTELPRDPVPDLGSRGTPLMALFARPPGEIGFQGRLFEVHGAKEAELAVLPADSGGSRNLFGVVPERPLGAGACYRAEFTWQADGVPVRRSICFETAR